MFNLSLVKKQFQLRNLEIHKMIDFTNNKEKIIERIYKIKRKHGQRNLVHGSSLTYHILVAGNFLKRVMVWARIFKLKKLLFYVDKKVKIDVIYYINNLLNKRVLEMNWLANYIKYSNKMKPNNIPH